MEKKSRWTQRDDRMRDRGDMQRRAQREAETHKRSLDRGDLKLRTKQAEDQKLKTGIPHKTKLTADIVPPTTNTEEAPKLIRKVEKPTAEFRQRIRDRYTLKPKGNLKVQIRKDEQVSGVEDDLSTKYLKVPEPIETPKQSLKAKSERSTKLRRPIKREPEHASKQAVTRAVKVAEKPLPTRLQNRDARGRLRRVKPRVPADKASSHKPARRRPPWERGCKRRPPSPEFSQAEILSPPTEVARWLHTRPYYEAWVDTTLAAISPYSKRDLDAVKSMETARERRRRGELVFADSRDERYTGRIRVKLR